MTVLYWLGIGLLGAVANRLRGGAVALPGGDLPGRLVWVALVVVLAFCRGMAPEWLAVLAVVTYASTTVGQFGALDMGRRSGMPWREAALRMAAYGTVRAVPVAVVFGLAGLPWWWLLLGIPGAVLAYDLPWRLPDLALRVRYLGRGSGPGVGRDPPEMAEALHGAMLAWLIWA